MESSVRVLRVRVLHLCVKLALGSSALGSYIRGKISVRVLRVRVIPHVGYTHLTLATSIDA